MAVGLACITGASVVRAVAAGTLRVDNAPVPIGPTLVKAALLAVGLTLLCLGHLRLVGDRSGRGAWRRPVISALLLHLLAATALPMLSNDLFSNLNFAHLLVHEHVSPYTTVGPRVTSGPLGEWVSGYWKTTPCVYGPVTMGYAALASFLAGPQNVVGGVVFFKALAALCSLLMVVFGYLYARGLADERSRLPVFWMVACNPVWLVEIAGQAHNDAAMVVLVMAALVAHSRGRPLLVVVLLTLGIAAKYVAAVPLGFLFLWQLWRGAGRWPRRWLETAGQAVAAAAVLVACYLPLWEGWATLTTPMASINEAKFAYAYLKLLYWAFGPQGVELPFRLVTGVLWLGLLGLTLWWVRGWRARSSSLAAWATAGRFVLVHTLVLNSHFLPWYIAWLIPLVIAETDRQWWVVLLVYGYLALFRYALTLPFPGEEAVNLFLIHSLPLVMVVRLLRGRPVLGRHLSRLGSLERVAATGSGGGQ
jgi:hypothetical protein